MAESFRATIVLANINHNMPAPQREADIDVVGQLVGRATLAVVGGCEIDNTPARDAWSRALPGPRWLTFGRTRETPLTVSAVWRVLSHRARRRHRGWSGVTPDRYTVVGRLEAPLGGKLAALATHMVSEAWTHHDDTTSRRRRMWRRHHRADQRTIARLRAGGYNTVHMGDLNNPHPVRYAAGQTVVYQGGLMQVTAVPAPGWSVEVVEVVKRAGHTDHPIVRAVLEFRRAA